MQGQIIPVFAFLILAYDRKLLVAVFVAVQLFVARFFAFQASVVIILLVTAYLKVMLVRAFVRKRGMH